MHLKRTFSCGILILLVVGFLTAGRVQAQEKKQNLTRYFKQHPELTRQQNLAVRYQDHRRGAFWIHTNDYRLRFHLKPGLTNTPVGLSFLGIGTRDRASLVREGSMNVVVRTEAGKRYTTAQANSDARINIFRHGPHYYQVHVYDLTLAGGNGKTLPVRGEVVFHAYPRKLYYELELHVTGKANVERAHLSWPLAGPPKRLFRGNGQMNDQPNGPFWMNNPDQGAWAGTTLTQRGTVALMTPSPRGTQRIGVSNTHDGPQLVQQLSLGKNRRNPARWSKGNIIEADGRLLTHPPSSNPAAALQTQARVESNPLTETEIQVGGNAQFHGYDPVRGMYTISTPEGKPTQWIAKHPNWLAQAPVRIHNDALRRRIYIRHEDSKHGGRVESGVVTGPNGYALPLLVQNSKNFSGEDEEPFYNPGDPGYAESYFPLALAPNQQLSLRSYHVKQNWGNHPLKQVGSLQAWMHYYQMSLGVTETTCFVPFRHIGHNGVWMADLRGISGTSWTGKPQYDNVGGHRYFHYIDSSGQEHFPVYRSSQFRFTGPNIADWGMKYVTDDRAAQLDVDIFEAPQEDETRCFVTMRVRFQKPVTIDNPAKNLRLISVDTAKQRLRYETVGYTPANGRWTEQPVDQSAAFPVGAPLAKEHPAVALYRVKKSSKKHGNNAIIVREFQGTAGGEPLDRLAFTVVKKKGPFQLAFLTLNRQHVRFEPGDTLTLKCMILPYGKIGQDHETVLTERRRWAVNPMRVRAAQGTVVEHTPSTVRVNQQSTARFRVEGGYGRVPILVEGFPGRKPPELEKRTPNGWQNVRMTRNGNEGHQTYLTPEGKYGFIFLTKTDGSPMHFRVRSP